MHTLLCTESNTCKALYVTLNMPLLDCAFAMVLRDLTDDLFMSLPSSLQR